MASFFFYVHFQPFIFQERGKCTQTCEGSANSHIRLQDAQVNQFESETTGCVLHFSLVLLPFKYVNYGSFIMHAHMIHTKIVQASKHFF